MHLMFTPQHSTSLSLSPFLSHALLPSWFQPGNTQMHWVLAGALRRSRNPCHVLPTDQLGLYSSKTCTWVDASYSTLKPCLWGEPNALACGGTDTFHVTSEPRKTGLFINSLRILHIMMLEASFRNIKNNIPGCAFTWSKWQEDIFFF